LIFINILAHISLYVEEEEEEEEEEEMR